MKKICIILVLVFLLVLPLITAKGLADIEKIDWKTKKLMITDEGIYDGINLIKPEDKAEIWIDKKIENTYHIDSLVKDDVLVDVKLFYDIQPDTIEYKSHNEKYQQVYTYDNWTWENKINCDKEEYCGGYAILEVILEYGMGSNTFTDAISGATWMDDGVNITLVKDIDYTQSGSTFTISNINYAWSRIYASYDYNVSSDIQEGISDLERNFTDFIPWIGIILLVIGAAIVLIIILGGFGKERI